MTLVGRVGDLRNLLIMSEEMFSRRSRRLPPSGPGGEAAVVGGYEDRVSPSVGAGKGTLVVLPNIAEGLLEDVVIADLELDVERLAKRLADLLVTADGALPAFESHTTNNLVDPADDVLDDDRSAIALE